MSCTIEITADKPGRTITIEAAGPAAPHPVTLEVGGLIGESEWSWLTTEEALAVGQALVDAASQAEIATRCS